MHRASLHCSHLLARSRCSHRCFRLRPEVRAGQRVHLSQSRPTTGLDCYLDAVVHLYTMCRHVKSIEIIEFGHAKAQEGVNGAKSEYCVDKQKINITRPYQAALREATPWRDAVEHLRELQQYWLDAMANLRWRPAKPPQDYEDRVDQGVRRPVVEDRRGARRRSPRRTDNAAASRPRQPAAAKPKRRRASLPRQRPRSPSELATVELADGPTGSASNDQTPGRRRRARRDLPRRRHAFARVARVPLPLAAARDGAGDRAGHRLARRSSSPKPAPAPARRSPISCRRCSTAARSSSPPAPRRCRTSSSSATCRWCATRSRRP